MRKCANCKVEYEFVNYGSDNYSEYCESCYKYLILGLRVENKEVDTEPSDIKYVCLMAVITLGMAVVAWITASR